MRLTRRREFESSQRSPLTSRITSPRAIGTRRISSRRIAVCRMLFQGAGWGDPLIRSSTRREVSAVIQYAATIVALGGTV